MIAGEGEVTIKKEKEPRMRSCAFYRCGALPAARECARCRCVSGHVRRGERGVAATSVMRAITYFRDFA